MLVSPGQERAGWNVLKIQRWGTPLKVTVKPMSKQRKPIYRGKHNNRRRSKKKHKRKIYTTTERTSFPISCKIPRGLAILCLRILWTQLLMINWPPWKLSQVGLWEWEEPIYALVQSLCFHIECSACRLRSHTHYMVLNSPQLLLCRNFPLRK